MKSKLYKEVVVKGNKTIQQAKKSGKIYKGISTINPSNKNVSLYDLSLIKQDLINHFHIRQGENLADPTFGTIIWDLLFEPMTPQLRNLIIDNVTNIVNSDPRIYVSQIIVDEYETGIQIECNIKYLLFNIQESMQLNFDKNAGFLSN